MRNFILLLAAMLFTTVSIAQTGPVDFETTGNGAVWTWNVFENDTNPPVQVVANPDMTGINTSATVGKITAVVAGAAWAGCETLHGTTEIGPFVLDATNSLIKIKVWKSVISDVGIKLIANSGWAQTEIKVANTLINQWEEITFDFSAYPNPPASEGAYDQIAFFPDFDLAGRAQSNVVYFDDITFNAAPIPVAPTTSAPVPPVRAVADVISVFSGAYANLSATDFNPSWGQSTVVTTPEIQNDSVLKYANFNYQGIGFATPVDASTMDFLHVDMWTGNATTVDIFAISTGPVETAFSLAVTPSQWVSYDIPLSAFTGVALNDIIQFKFDGGTGSETIYLDNIYFYVDNTPVMALNAPVDFETNGYGANFTWNVFENGGNAPLDIITNPDMSGINTSATVAKFTALTTGAAWAGTESAHGNGNLGSFVLDATNSLIKIKVWKTVISDVGIKLVAANGWSAGEIKVANTLINQWEEIIFDFSAYPNPPASEGAYDQVAVFPDFDLNGRTQDNIVYFDDITFNAATAVPSEPTVAAPVPPVRAEANYISVFSNAYINVPNTDFNPNWGQSTIVTTPEIQNDSVLKYANLNYQGTAFATPLDVTTMAFLHLDMWTADATAVNIFCISTGPVETAYSLPITVNQWVSYDIPLSSYTGVDLADIIQFKFDGGTGSESIYLDNIYFHINDVSIGNNDANNADFKLYPNPVNAGDKVKIDAEVKIFTVYDITGKSVLTGNSTELATDNLNKGMYFIVVENNDGNIQTQKLIVK